MKITLTDKTGKKIVIDTTLPGYSYKRKKEAARQLAIDTQAAIADCSLYGSQLATLADIFETIGERFGLLTEFRENGIC